MNEPHPGPTDPVPPTRIRACNDTAVRSDGDYVLYWMIAARRSSSSHSLDRAIAWAKELGQPLVVFEALRLGYRWSSPRFHRFVIDGMSDNAAAFSKTPVTYYPYLETDEGGGKGLLEKLSERASVIVTDEFPTYFLPRMVAAAAERVSCRLEAIDTNGILPLQRTDRAFPTAHSFRRHLQKTLPDHLDEFPDPAPLDDLDLPKLRKGTLDAIQESWPPAALDEIDNAWIEALPLERSTPIVSTRGGSASAQQLLDDLLGKIDRYAEDRNQPMLEATSGLSPFLHFGHVGSTQIVGRLLEHEEWKPSQLSPETGGKREGWWGASKSTEAYLDQVITWRELGYVACYHNADLDRFDGLPEWARESLDEHVSDPRDPQYDLDTLDRAETYDDIWNAAQRQLRQEGIIHNYLRMLWGKKVLEWSTTPQEAFDTLVELNNAYALDGRNPNSYSGISWIFGRFDRAWGPEREIFGKIRYMSSDNTARKLKIKPYLEKYGQESEQMNLFD